MVTAHCQSRVLFDIFQKIWIFHIVLKTNFWKTLFQTALIWRQSDENLWNKLETVTTIPNFYIQKEALRNIEQFLSYSCLRGWPTKGSTHSEWYVQTQEQRDMTLLCVGVFQEPNRPWTDHQWGLCVFDDVIEYTGPQALRYQQHFVEQMLHYASDGQPDVRQAAAYGLGVMGQHGGPEFAPGLPTNLILLPLIVFQNHWFAERANEGYFCHLSRPPAPSFRF